MKENELKASLEKVISKWIEEISETNAWIDGYVGENVAKDMTEASICILRAVEDTNQYIENNK